MSRGMLAPRWSEARRAGWEAVFEMEDMDLKGGHLSKGAAAVAVDLALAIDQSATSLSGYGR